MSGQSESTVGRAVDWNFAGTVGARLARPAPPATDYTRRQAIEELAAAARAAEGPVREVTRMGGDAPVPEARVVDREGWIRAASESMRVMTGGTHKPSNPITGRVTGAQTGAVLAFVSSGILGQYDPFAGAEVTSGGHLLLVYPNVIAVERQLRVAPADFRLWVCLHEVTHRVQFTANPWLAQHMSQALGVLTSDGGDDVAQVVGRLSDFVRSRRAGAQRPGNDPRRAGAQRPGNDPRRAGAQRPGNDPRRTGGPGGPNDAGILGFMRAVQSEPQRVALDQLLVLGTLLEGHADHVMDAVGPAVVPSVQTIRRRFDQRRQRRQPPVQRLLRALLGVDAKLSQYTRGKAFVDQVVDRVGMDRFNTIWTSPETLPLTDEIEDPQQWIDRVL